MPDDFAQLVKQQTDIVRIVSVLFFLVGTATASIAQTAVAWPEADKLFHSDPRWLGADGAFSIDLGNNRVLWMFNDTFVARHPGDDRPHAAFLHNTVAIQTGYDPSHATIKFYWRSIHGGASEIFPSEGQIWMWPGSGIRIGNRLLLFCERIAPDSAKDSLGFKSVGWNAYWVTDPDEEPTAWKLKVAARISDTVIMASQVLRNGSFIFVFGQSEPKHDLFAARWSVDTSAQAKLDALKWWSGKDWSASPLNRHPIQQATGTETSIQPDPKGTGFIEVESKGFGASDIVMRRAQNLEGPWSTPQIIYRPPESDAPDAFVYAGKSHAELKGADLILTYVANGRDEKLAKDMTIYFPRFVKVDLHSQTAAK